MLNFFKNNINKKIKLQKAFRDTKNLNKLIKINNFNFINFNNNNNKITNGNKLIEANILENFTIYNFNFKSFIDKSDSGGDKGKSGERRRMGKSKEATEEILKKRMESIKITQEEKEKIIKKEIEEKEKEEKREKDKLLEIEQIKKLEEKKKAEMNKKKIKDESSSSESEKETVKIMKKPEIKEKKEEVVVEKKQDILKENLEKEEKVEKLQINNEEQFVSFNSYLSRTDVTDENKEIFAKILGDMRKIDANNKFDSKVINDLYEEIRRSKGLPIIKSKPFDKNDYGLELDIEIPESHYRKRAFSLLRKKFYKILILLFLYHVYIYFKDRKDLRHYRPLIKQFENIKMIFGLLKNTLIQPFYRKLLPEIIVIPGRPKPKTLILNFEDTLVHAEYKIGAGLINYKRPHLAKFLEELGNYYEIVVFSSKDDSMTVQQICKEIDKYDTNIKHYLGKEATLKYEGYYIKDLNYINRDLKNVIVIDNSLDNVKKHPNNLIILPKFVGDPNDQEFKIIIPFLKEMAKPSVTDVREELEKYGTYKPYYKFYQSNPKYHVLIPKEASLSDDEDIVEIRKIK